MLRRAAWPSRDPVDCFAGAARDAALQQALDLYHGHGGDAGAALADLLHTQPLAAGALELWPLRDRIAFVAGIAACGKHVGFFE